MVPEIPMLGGHGLALILSHLKEISSYPSQYLGLLNATDDGNSIYHIFAVEFDIVKDLGFGDIDDNHVGIHLDSVESIASASAAYFLENSTKKELILKSEKMIQAWIDCDPAIDRLEDSMFVGFSASTGLLASSHYVLGWSFNMSGKAESLSLPSLPFLPRPKQNHTVLILCVTFSAVLVVMSIVFISLYFV